MLAARRVGVGAGAPRGSWQAATKLSTQLQSLHLLPPRLPTASGRVHPLLPPPRSRYSLHVVSSRSFSQPPQDSKSPVMRLKDAATARNNRILLRSTPDDADLARVVFRETQAVGGRPLTNFTATTIASALLKDGAFRESVDVMEYAREQGVRVDPKIYLTTFSAVSRAKQYAEVLRVWDAIRAGNYQHIPWQYTSALVAAVHLKQKERVFEILDGMEANGVKDAEMYQHVLGAACQTKQHDLVWEILSYMHASGVDSTVYFRNSIRVALKSGDYDFVLELLRLKKEHGLDPTNEYNHQIMLLRRAGLFDKLLSVFEAMRKAGCSCHEGTYGIVLESAVRLMNRDVVASVLEDIKQSAKSHETRSVVFPRAVRAAIWTKQHQLVLDLFDFMDQAGVDAYDVYSSAITAAFKSKQYDFVLDILQKMTENGVDASGEYGHVLMLFSKLHCYDLVLRAFWSKRELGYEQEEAHCTAALQAAIKLDRHDDVLAICDGSVGKGFNSTRLYSFALRQARTANKQVLVNDILDHIKKPSTGVKKHTPEKLTATAKKHPIAATKATTKAKKPTTTEPSEDGEVLPEYLERTPISTEPYRVALQAVDEAEDAQETLSKILDQFLDNAEDPSTVYLIMLQQANRLRRHGLVMAIADHATNIGFDLTMQMYAILLRSCVSVNNLEAALGVARTMQSNGLAMTEATAACLTKCAAKLDEWDTVIDILAKLQSEGVQPKLTMYTSALAECQKRGHLNRAVDIYTVMPKQLRAQLSNTSLIAVIRGHAYSDSKEHQRRAVEILNIELRHALSPKQHTNLLMEVRQIALKTRREMVRKSTVTLEPTTEPVDDLDERSSSSVANTSSGKGMDGVLFDAL